MAWASSLEEEGVYKKLLKESNLRRISGISWLFSCDDCNITKGILVETEQKSYRKGSRERMPYQTFETRNGSTSGNGSICLQNINTGWNAHLRFEDDSSPSRYFPPGYAIQCMCDRDCITKRPSVDHKLINTLWSCLNPIESFAFPFNLMVILY